MPTRPADTGCDFLFYCRHLLLLTEHYGAGICCRTWFNGRFVECTGVGSDIAACQLHRALGDFACLELPYGF